ncbi:MAG: hypothetical protein E6I77_11345 [Chloroflexi bacterium]|nr:MAG: hypothetical protein E6I77_11345 [Chloroflexota bacterium]
MTILRNLRFALNSAWQSFWRNLAVSLAAVVSITLILILAGMNLLVGHAFSQVLDGFREKVSEMSINVADDTPLTSVYAFQQQLGRRRLDGTAVAGSRSDRPDQLPG